MLFYWTLIKSTIGIHKNILTWNKLSVYYLCSYAELKSPFCQKAQMEHLLSTVNEP